MLTFADATGSFNLNAWSDAPLFEAAQGMPDGTVVRLDAEWTQNQYGVNPNNLTWFGLDDAAIADFDTALGYAPLAEVARLLHAQGADAVVLGCTEIPLGVAAGPPLGFPVVDTVAALARAAIAWALAERRNAR